MRKQTFLGGVLILLAGGAIAKVLGAVYRIPLTWILGAEGLGLYQLVFPIFSLLLVLSSTGMPTAISKMVAERMGSNNLTEARKILRVSVVVLGIFGLAGSAVLLVCSELIANLQGNALATLPYAAIAPAVFLVSILSAYRGYFQGRMNMTPTSASQIIEQLGKLIFGLLLGYLWIGNGVEYGALGAVLGVTLSEVLAVGAMLVFYKKSKKSDVYSSHVPVASSKALSKELLKTALPIVGASLIMPVSLVVDSMLIVNLLGSAGFSVSQATIMWGINSGVVNSIVNMPVVLTLAVATTVVPVLSEKVATSNVETVRDKLGQAMRLTLNIALPCAAGIMLLAPHILGFLYHGSLSVGEIDEFALGVSLLQVSSVLVLFIALLQVQNAALQGMGYLKAPLINLVIAGLLKLAVLLTLTTLPDINIYGAVISNFVFYIFAVLSNALYMRKKFGYRFMFKRTYPALISLGTMVLALIVCANFCANLSVYIALPLEIVFGAVAYIGTLYVFGGMGDLKPVFNRIFKRKAQLEAE